MNRLLPLSTLLLSFLCSGCKPDAGAAAQKSPFLEDARRDFHTVLTRQDHDGTPPPEPPDKRFQLAHYPSPAGSLAAYVTTSPGDGKRLPAIIWLAGGFSNSIGDTPWTPQSPKNDQSASAFWKAGLVTMYPSLRGGNDNPGYKEGFYGEVDDVLAAASWLAKLDYVAPDHIYLGGHSTGGTLALLAGECSDRFRAVFAFGPTDDIGSYGHANLPFDVSIPSERLLRSPGHWLESIRKPTFVFEGMVRRSNITSLLTLSRTPHPDTVQIFPVRNADHFSTLSPVTQLIAAKIHADEGPMTNIAFSDQELREIVPAEANHP